MAGRDKGLQDRKGNRYRPAQARPQTLEQLRQYVWIELQNIGGALNTADDDPDRGLKLCEGLVNEPTLDGSPSITYNATDGDLLEYVPESVVFCVGRRTRYFAEGFVQGNVYERGDEVANGSQIAEAIVDGATEYPFISPTGDPLESYDGTLTDTNDTQKNIVFGQRFQINIGGYINSVKVYVHAGQDYTLYSVVDPLGSPVFNQYIQFTADTTGWLDVNTGQITVSAGSVIDIVVLASEPAATPTTFDLTYNYQTPQNPGAPAAGAITHSRSAPGQMSISYTATGGADATAQLQSLTTGDSFSTATQQWVITTIADNGTYITFGVSPAVNDSTGTKVFTFETVTPTPIDYSFETDYYNPQPFPNVTINGIIGLGTGYAGATIDDSAYGVNLIVQDAYVPTQWSVKVTSEGGTALAPTRPQVIFTDLTTYNVIASDENALICTTSDLPVSFVMADGTLPAGFITHVHQYGLGQVTVSADGASSVVSSRSVTTRAQHSALSVFNLGNGTYSVVGDQT